MVPNWQTIQLKEDSIYHIKETETRKEGTEVLDLNSLLFFGFVFFFGTQETEDERACIKRQVCDFIYKETQRNKNKAMHIICAIVIIARGVSTRHTPRGGIAP